MKTETPNQTIYLLVIALCLLFAIATASAQTSQSKRTSDNKRPLIRTNRTQLTLAGAEFAIVASRKQAKAMGVRVNIAVVDDGGHLLAFSRMDGARPASVYTSITKATSAATMRGATGPLPNADAVNTHHSLAVENAVAVSGGKFTTLKGGIPIVFDGHVIGAIGVGGATGEQDAEVASVGVAELTRNFESAINKDKSTKSTSLFRKWLIEDIEGRGVIDNAQTTMQIEQDGSVTGSTGVNQYMAKAKIDEQKIEIEPGPATTRAAGPPALMGQEFKFLATLPRVRQYRFGVNGMLHLLDNKGKTLLRASQMKSHH